MSPDDFVCRIQSRIELARHPLVSASVVHDQHGKFGGGIHERRVSYFVHFVNTFFKINVGGGMLILLDIWPILCDTRRDHGTQL